MLEQASAAQFPEWTVAQLKAKIDSGEAIQVIDVREPDEFKFCRIPGSVLIPLNDLPSRIGEIDPDIPTVVHCKMGGRSFQAMVFLRQNGLDKVSNLAGGIMAWAEQIDPRLPRYW